MSIRVAKINYLDFCWSGNERKKGKGNPQMINKILKEKLNDKI